MEPKSFFGVDTMNAPWGLDSRLKLVALACEFFDARKLTSNHKAIGKDVPSGTNPEPLTGHDFLTHSEVDVAVIQVDGAPLTGFPGAIFQRPVEAQTVYTLGYPKLPGLREASVTMQQGAVTNESVTSLSGESLFLYSAISRPGNSGGPVVSEDGYIVGLSIVDAKAEYCSDEAFSPHYAGIPSQVVVEAVASLGLGMELPYEDYE